MGRIYVGSIAAVAVIGSLAWSAAVVYKKYQEGKYLERLVDQQALSAEHKGNLIDATKKLTDMFIDAEAHHLYNEHFVNSGAVDFDQIERLKLL